MKLLALATLAVVPHAISYKITAYSEPDCKGVRTDIDVWDDTCAYPFCESELGYLSFEVTEYGKHRQTAAFYRVACVDQTSDDWCADGQDDDFQMGRCINFSERVGCMESVETLDC